MFTHIGAPFRHRLLFLFTIRQCQTAQVWRRHQTVFVWQHTFYLANNIAWRRSNPTSPWRCDAIPEPGIYDIPMYHDNKSTSKSSSKMSLKGNFLTRNLPQPCCHPFNRHFLVYKLLNANDHFKNQTSTKHTPQPPPNGFCSDRYKAIMTANQQATHPQSLIELKTSNRENSWLQASQ